MSQYWETNSEVSIEMAYSYVLTKDKHVENNIVAIIGLDTLWCRHGDKANIPLAEKANQYLVCHLWNLYMISFLEDVNLFAKHAY